MAKKGEKRRRSIELGDSMLDRDGVYVEPHVRKALQHYFKKMHLRETTYSRRTAFFANKWEDPQEEYYDDNDDPVGLKLHARQNAMRNDISCDEALRYIVRSMLDESQEIGGLQLGIVTIPGTGLKTKLTVIYSIPALDWTLSRLFGTRVPKPDPDDLVIAGVEWGKPSEVIKSIDWEGDGPCNYAYVVRRSVTSFPGWGRKAYIAAVHSAGELGPDRGIVKPGAERAWGAIAGDLEAHPYDDIENPKTPQPDDDCRLHIGRPILNASYTISSAPSDITKMIQSGERHFTMLEKHGDPIIVSKAKMVLKIEFDTIFREKYGSGE